MFRYDNTHKVSKPREKQVKQVIHTRKVTYINPHPNPKVKEPVVTEGWEIVKEIVIDPKVPLDVAPDVVGYKTVSTLKEEENDGSDKALLSTTY